MHEHLYLPQEVPPPKTVQECRERMVALQDEIASIRIQIATTDLRRQADRKSLDPAWFHRAKTALRLRQQELARVSAHLASLPEGQRGTHRDAFKDALIEAVRTQCDDEQWRRLMTRAKALHAIAEAHHG